MTYPHGLRALKHDEFRRFYFSQFAAQVGSWMQNVQEADAVARLGVLLHVAHAVPLSRQRHALGAHSLDSFREPFRERRGRRAADEQEDEGDYRHDTVHRDLGTSLPNSRAN